MITIILSGRGDATDIPEVVVVGRSDRSNVWRVAGANHLTLEADYGLTENPYVYMQVINTPDA
jgi:hypothetical protein